mmetsp:Transcript_7650/g.21726  ORF Transcript_7650/g.21726 Transcript_7650/m.21726 type:complete len:392 (+) Transcript_7650:72-1247(+)
MVRRKKGSARKARKKNQRKIDISDVEAAQAERTAQVVLENSANDSLFVVDTGRPTMSGRAKREAIRKKKTAVELAAYPTNPVEKNSVMRTTRDQPKVIGRKRKRPVASGQGAEGSPELPASPPSRDLWGGAALSPAREVPSAKRRKVTVTKDAALLGTAPGMSYRPHPDDHQETLGVAVADEMERVRQIEDVEDRFKVSKEVRKLRRGMIEDASFFDDPNYDTEEEGGEETALVERPAKPPTRRVTRRERNKELRKREERRKLRHKRTAERIRKDVDRIPEIIQRIEEKEDLRAQERQRKKAVAEVLPVVKKVGGRKPEKLPVVVALSDEVPSDMRSLKRPAYYNAMKESFVELHEKGKVEPRQPFTRRRRHAKKAVYKREYREFMAKHNT